MVEIADKLESVPEGIVLQDITVERESFPIIFLHQSGIFLFLDDGNLAENKTDILNKVYKLQYALRTGRNKMWIYSIDDKELWTGLNPLNDDIVPIFDPIEHVQQCIDSGVYHFESARLDYYADKLEFGGGKQSENLKAGRDGELYVKRGGHWFPASDEDSDEVFQKACLLGVFGWFQFHTGHVMGGVLYLVTCGFFGVGWLFDLLQLLIGCARDRDGYYFRPISDRKKGLMYLCICTAMSFLLVFLYLKGMGAISSVISRFVAPMVDAQSVAAIH